MREREECRKTKGDPAEEPDRLLVSVVQHWYIVRVDDGRGIENPLNLILEIKSCRGEDAREQKGAMDTYWVCGVSHSGQFGNWAFAEFRDVYESGTDFGRLVAETSGKLVVDRG